MNVITLSHLIIVFYSREFELKSNMPLVVFICYNYCSLSAIKLLMETNDIKINFVCEVFLYVINATAYMMNFFILNKIFSIESLH